MLPLILAPILGAAMGAGLGVAGQKIQQGRQERQAQDAMEVFKRTLASVGGSLSPTTETKTISPAVPERSLVSTSPGAPKAAPQKQVIQQGRPAVTQATTKPATHSARVLSGPGGISLEAVPLETEAPKLPSIEDLKVAYILNQEPQEQGRIMQNMIDGQFDLGTEIENQYFTAKLMGNEEEAGRFLGIISELKRAQQLPSEFEKEYSGFVRRMSSLGYEAAPPEDFKNKFRIKDQLYRAFDPASGMLGLIQAMSPTEKLNVLQWWYQRKAQEMDGPRLFTDEELDKMETDIVAKLKVHPIVHGQFVNSLQRTGGDIEQAIKDTYPVALADQESGGDPAAMQALLTARKQEMEAKAKNLPEKKGEPGASFDWEIHGPWPGGEEPGSEAYEMLRELFIDTWSRLRGSGEPKMGEQTR